MKFGWIISPRGIMGGVIALIVTGVAGLYAYVFNINGLIPWYLFYPKVYLIGAFVATRVFKR